MFTILNVDDNENARRVSTLILERAGFRVLEAATGGEALSLISREAPHLVLLDVELPDIPGWEVCRRIKLDLATSWIPVLQVSGSFVELGDRVRALEQGADGYLLKPFDYSVLIATVRSLLRLQQAEETVRHSAHQWQTTFDAIADGVVLLDRDGLILRCNEAFRRLVGRSFQELIGQPARLVTPVITRLANQAAKQSAESTEAAIESFGD